MKTKRKYQRLALSTWAKICGEWEIGDVTLAELSDRFGVNTRTLQAHFAKHAVVKGAKAAELASSVKEELFKLELDGKDGLTQRARETRETAYKNADQEKLFDENAGRIWKGLVKSGSTDIQPITCQKGVAEYVSKMLPYPLSYESFVAADELRLG
jgi:hypothetical protein